MASKFTVEFDEEGTITRVFNGALSADSKSLPFKEIRVHSNQLNPEKIKSKIASNLRGHSVRNVTTVTIVKANPICIIQGGTLYHIP